MVRVCADDKCVERRAKIGKWEMIFMRDATLTGPGQVDVSVTVFPARDPTLAQAITFSSTVQARRYQPNGPGCDPVVYAASVDVTDDGIQQRPQP